MKKILAVLFVMSMVALYVIPALAADAQYIGAKKCMMCHKTEAKGNQWGKWEAGPHAKAFATLKTEEAKAVAKKVGVADPTTDVKCLKCHVTGGGQPATKFAAGFTQDEGVGCEACHGPGSLYKGMNVMKAITAGTQDLAAVAFENGTKACVKCHNQESPTYKPFDYAKFWAKIDHSMPKK